MSNPIYKRIMLKLSGEALLGEQDYGIDAKAVKSFYQQLIEVVDLGVEVVVEIGGGSIYRWRTAQEGIDREAADMMGMLGSVMNALNFSAIDQGKIKALGSLAVPAAIDNYTIRAANQAIKNGQIVVIGGGTGNQYFTTDTGAAIHALQLQCEVILKGTNVDGVYSSDPNKDSSAQKYDQVSFQEILDKELAAMDMTAFTLCRDNDLPLVIFNVLEEGNLKKVVQGEEIGTKIVK